MTIKYIREQYGVPIRRGMRFEAYYQTPKGWQRLAGGQISSATHVIHSKEGHRFHPTYGMVYFNGDGEIVFDGRKNA